MEDVGRERGNWPDSWLFMTFGMFNAKLTIYQVVVGLC